MATDGDLAILMNQSENNTDSTQHEQPSKTHPSNGIVNIRERLAVLEQQIKDIATKDWVSNEISQKESSFFKWLLGIAATGIIGIIIAIIKD